MSDELGTFARVYVGNFWRPPRRSWPYPPTRLERLAAKYGIDDEELRGLLRAEIERRSALGVESTGRKNGPAA